MLVDSYSGLATIVQAGGVEVQFMCSYRVEQAPYDGPIGWRGSFTERHDDDQVGARLDPLAVAELVLPDGRRGTILIDGYSPGVDYSGRTERGTFIGTGPYPGQ